MADEVVLLSSWFSPFAHRVRIALEEKGVHYDLKEEDLMDKSPLLLKLNPVHKKVPVFIHNGNPVCESLVIIHYIDEVWSKGSSLLPRDAFERANARFWAGLVDQKVFDCSKRIALNKGETQKAAKEEYIGYLKLMERELGEKPYFGGDAFGYVDIALIPFACQFYTYETFANFSVEEECPRLIAWVKRCMERESVSKTLPDPHKIYEYICALKKRLGIE